MLRPTKYSHPDQTVIGLSVLLLPYLRAKRICDYSSLRKLAKKKVIGGDVLFLPTLNFLYLMGLIEYRPKTDAIEYVGPNEVI